MDDHSDISDDEMLETAELDADDLGDGLTPRVCPGCD